MSRQPWRQTSWKEVEEVLALKKHPDAAGSIDYRHSFVDMTKIEVQASNWTQLGKTCKPAMGFGFAAGTTDGEILECCGVCFASTLHLLAHLMARRPNITFATNLGLRAFCLHCKLNITKGLTAQVSS